MSPVQNVNNVRLAQPNAALLPSALRYRRHTRHRGHRRKHLTITCRPGASSGPSPGAPVPRTNAKARAQVLRSVAEDPDLNSAEFNRAFVLMQFFGYLRRNPNDAPDSDYTGYDFWLTKLNQFNGNFVNADMVKAFINSSEYRQRFGP
jgi:hypothetical protein